MSPVEEWSLHGELRSLDDETSVVFRDDMCEWVRCRMGIIGCVVVGPSEEAQVVQREIEEAIQHAHAALDQLPLSELSSDDLWNLLLFIKVPWKKSEILVPSLHAIAEVLDNVARDLEGSRKVILWADLSPGQVLGPLVTSAGRESGSRNPLRVVIAGLARDSIEAEALKLIFSKRISDSDVDDLIEALTMERRT